MRYYMIVLVMMMFIAGCGDEKPALPPPPADLIPEQKFTQILMDVRMLEGAYATRYQKVDSSALRISSYYLKLFADHGVTGEQFAGSYSWYIKDIPKMAAIEDTILNRLQVMQLAQDSLNRLNRVSDADTVMQDSVIRSMEKPAPPLIVKKKI